MHFRDLHRAGLFAVTLIITAAILLGTGLSGHSRLSHALQDSGHFLIFTPLSLIALWSYRGSRGEPVWQVMLGCLLFGILIEAVQHLIGRDPSLKDVLMDLLGILAGTVLYLGFIRHSFSSGLTLVAVMVLAMAAFSQPCYWLGVYQLQANEFPQLLNPDNFFTNGLLEANPGGEIRRITLPENWSMPPDLGLNSCIYVSLLGGRWPGIHMQELESDWRGYESLEVAIYSDQEKDLPLILGIHDRSHNYKLNDRYSRRLLVHPGYNHFSLPTHEIEHAPKERPMDLWDISDLKVFAAKEQVGRGFCLLSMGLR